MDVKFLARILGLSVAVSSTLWAFGCSSGDESLGSDTNAAAQGKGGSSSNTEPNCEMIECLRAVECVERCGGPVVQASCCPCPDGLLDELVECSGGGNEGGASSGGASSGGTMSMGGYSAAGSPSNGEGGYAQGGEPGSVEPDLTQLHAACDLGGCPAGLTAMEYYGFAGPSGPLFCSCEIPCEEIPHVCPPTTTCVVISDGPGAVCSE